jgi:hypothetical protein
MMAEEIRVYFCPKCKSTDVRYVFGLMNLFGTIPMKECGSCGLSAPTFPILIAKKSSLEKIEAKKKGSTKKILKKGAAVLHTPKRRNEGAKNE